MDISASLPTAARASLRLLQLHVIVALRMTKSPQVTVMHGDSSLSTWPVDKTVHQPIAPRLRRLAASSGVRLAKKTPTKQSSYESTNYP
ncbi:hypothetical protein [Pseudoxanthomonas yeongjuensis]|uniref:hypothetical protein n=1 Tax=Pseudoxanthomonas yeongjuensis TaxID=377616 RepID=UPI0013907ABB|nr:hypothetical protein [Pseudoxanthomonas yeongjuensis]